MNSEGERWVSVPGYEGFYEVSDRGGVRSLERRIPDGRGRMRRIAPRDRRHTTLPVGYQQIQLHRDGTSVARLVHRLVLEAFIGPPPPGMEACHNNGDVTDNRLTNLRWDSHQANMQDAIRAGTHRGAVTRCPAGHDYTPANTYLTPVGARQCRACQRIRARNATPAAPPCCAQCGTPIPRTGSLGRPKKWCSDTCRRSAAAAVARLRYAEVVAR